MEEAIDIHSVLNERLIQLDIKGTKKEEVLNELVDILYQEKMIISKEEFLKDVYMREEEGLTGIGDHVAIPHGKSDSVIRTAVAIGRSKQDIEWNSIDGKPVRIVFLLAIKSLDRTVHIRLLSRIATSLCDRDAIQQLLICQSAEEVIDILEEKGGAL